MAAAASTPQMNLIEFGLGIVALIIGAIVLAFSSTAIDVLVVILAIGLIAIGLAGILFGLMKRDRPQWQRVAIPVLGAVGVVVGGLVLAFPDFGEGVLVLLLAIGLLIQGTYRLTSEALNADAPSQTRLFHGIVGFATIGLALAVILAPGTGQVIIVLLLGIGLLLVGLAAVISGYRNL